MSIADAILALSPNLYWKLNEGSGTTANNSGSLSNDGTISGSVNFAADGPEAGTTALQLFNLGQCVSAAMDLGAPSNVSMCCWFSSAFDAAGNPLAPFMGIGDPTNRLARGPVLYTQVFSGNPTIFGRWSGTTSSNDPILGDTTGWHFVMLTLQTGTNGQKLYHNGRPVVQSTMSGAVNCLSSDPMLLRSASNIVIAHVAFWNRVLGPSEIDGIWAQRAIWGLLPPVASPPATGGGGGGGLTTDQAAQLSEIDTKTDALPGITAAVSYISDTVNTINGFVQDTNTRVQALQSQMTDVLGGLDAIMASVGASLESAVSDISSFVQRVFQTGTGAFLSSPIGSLLSHPDPNLLQASSSSFVISGRGTCPSPGTLSFGNVFGIQWEATTIPIRAGYRQGVIDEYNQRLVQFVRYFIEPHTGILYAGDIADFAYQNYTWFWDRPFPHQIDYDVLPGFELTCRYIYLTP